MTAQRIYQLPTHLANQIAAGEVVERPASVLKELLENSLDAKSSQIEITIEKGGVGLIRIQDNGVGICKEDLQLAIASHATSKIKTIEDLESILSFGFRGEALASISAVSRLNLSSWVTGQEMGWCIHREGRDVSPVLTPVPKRQGTSIEVRDLFYNTPARRKFLRSEKTESAYLEEIFKRIALSQPEVAFKFQQGKRSQRHLPSCRTLEARTKRVALLCGQSFIEEAYYVQAEANGLILRGWLGAPTALRAQADLQYFYVNGRIVRDKVITHAVRQAYQEVCLPGRYPAYVLYFEVDPASVDVNVHPTKHEVRFREARTVHAFLSYAVREGLKQVERVSVPLPWEGSPGSKNIQYRGATQTQDLSKFSSSQPLSILGGEFLLAENTKGWILFDLKAARMSLIQKLLREAYEGEGISKRPLLMPEVVNVGNKAEKIESLWDWQRLGFELNQVGHNTLLIRSVPEIFGAKIDNLEFLMHTLLNSAEEELCFNVIVNHVIETQPISMDNIRPLLIELEQIGILDENDEQGSKFYREVTVEQLRAVLF